MDEIPAQSWKYEMRRQMQQIMPKVWLGPYAVAKQRDVLLAAGITHILCLKDVSEDHIVKVAYPQDFQYLCLSLSDGPNACVLPLIAESSKFIAEGLCSGGSVLVYCISGISRSPAVVIAYMMDFGSLTYDQAFQAVVKRRFCINPNEWFKHQLNVC